ncbi:MAG: ZIP family metal transporter [Bacteroidaceae bacterium]|nr:ZIP family metal transporter [Bacteroidaceae bacterium]
MQHIWISAAALCGASLIGSVLGFFIKDLPHRWNDTIIGYCAGIMLAASIVGLILPAIDLASNYEVIFVVTGVIMGALFLNFLDHITPHLHHITGLDPEQHKNNASLNRIMLFVLAIAIHKFPEGMAAGIGFNTDDISNAWTVTAGLSLQNVPEGMVVISPLLLSGISKLRTLLISLLIAMLEIIGVWIGFVAGNISEQLLPFMLAFAGGAMLYVVSDEMIPETHAHGYQKSATYALLLGFLSLVLMERFFE